MSLYQKYRPASFEKMIGNDSQLESLKNMMEKENPPHVYLFFGPSGCGKTTAARICADMLGASDISTMEINTSNNRGIQTAREIINQIKYVSIDGKKVVYIIDECHQLTNDFQQAMLKPLEDTPDHIYFFLCTTNPEKLSEAIRTRCAEFSFGFLPEKLLYRLLCRVKRFEEIGITKELLEHISENSQGSPRRALVLLEKVTGMNAEKAFDLISIDFIDDKNVIDLCRLLIADNNDWKGISKVLKSIQNQDMEKTRRGVLGYMNIVLLNKKHNKAAIVLENFSEPFYNSGKSGLTLACYQSLYSE